MYSLGNIYKTGYMITWEVNIVNMKMARFKENQENPGENPSAKSCLILIKRANIVPTGNGGSQQEINRLDTRGSALYNVITGLQVLSWFYGLEGFLSIISGTPLRYIEFHRS